MKVFIDGSAGTTGLKIQARLSERRDVELSVLPDALRKDPSARKDAIDASDVSFLCLPDAAAAEAAAMCENPSTVVIDTSTAHRTDSGWTYGFPELEGMREKIASAKRIANPGCHASGFIALVEPLVRSGVLSRDAALCAFSLTGYSGGGKKMIAEYEGRGVGEEGKGKREERRGMRDERGVDLLSGGRQYALGQSHKHLPEMVAVCGLERAPVFSPVVIDHFSGMEVTVQVFADAVAGGLEAIRRVFAGTYSKNRGGVVEYVPDLSRDGFVSSCDMSGTDAMRVGAFGNGERIVLVSVFDNLGKGASGAAIQNMNIATGSPEFSGLVLP